MSKIPRSKPITATGLRIPITCLKFLGVWYYNGPYRILYLIYGTIIYLSVSILYAATMFMNEIMVWGDLLEMADGLVLLITVSCIAFKIGLLDKKKLNNLVEMIASEPLNSQTEDQDVYIRRAMDTAHRNSCILLSICTVIAFLLDLDPLLTGAYKAKKLPLKAWFPFPYTVSPYYEVAYLYQFIGIWVGALMNCSTDVLVAGILAIARGQLEILKNSLRNLRSRALVRMDLSSEDELCDKCHNGPTQWKCDDVSHLTKADGILEEEIYQEMLKCLRHHQAIDEYVREIEATFTLSIFSQFSASMLVICITAFELSVIKPFTMMFFSILLYLMNMLLQLFFYCWYGNEVYLMSMTINEDIYKSDWYRFGSRVAKLMLTMMERSKKPMNITAGKLFPLSVDTFTSILRSAYSFYAVLNQMEVDIDFEKTAETN